MKKEINSWKRNNKCNHIKSDRSNLHKLRYQSFSSREWCSFQTASVAVLNTSRGREGRVHSKSTIEGGDLSVSWVANPRSCLTALTRTDRDILRGHSISLCTQCPNLYPLNTLRVMDSNQTLSINAPYSERVRCCWSQYRGHVPSTSPFPRPRHFSVIHVLTWGLRGRHKGPSPITRRYSYWGRGPPPPAWHVRVRFGWLCHHFGDVILT